MPHKHSSKVPPEFEDLASQIGDFIEYWGFKKIHGQIWTHVFLSQNPIDATTLVKRLHVSKALVSLAIKDLLKYEVIQVVGQGSRRKVLFQSNPDLTRVIISVLRKRERRMLSTIMSSFKNMKKLKDEDKAEFGIHLEKTEELGQMIENAEQTLDILISTDLDMNLPT